MEEAHRAGAQPAHVVIGDRVAQPVRWDAPEDAVIVDLLVHNLAEQLAAGVLQIGAQLGDAGRAPLLAGA